MRHELTTKCKRYLFNRTGGGGISLTAHTSYRITETAAVYFIEQRLDFPESLRILSQSIQPVIRPSFYFHIGYAQRPGDIYCFVGDFFKIPRAFFNAGLDAPGYCVHLVVLSRRCFFCLLCFINVIFSLHGVTP